MEIVENFADNRDFQKFSQKSIYYGNFDQNRDFFENMDPNQESVKFWPKSFFFWKFSVKSRFL